MKPLTDSVQFDSFDPHASIGMIAAPDVMDERIQQLLAKIDCATTTHGSFSLKKESQRSEEL